MFSLPLKIYDFLRLLFSLSLPTIIATKYTQVVSRVSKRYDDFEFDKTSVCVCVCVCVFFKSVFQFLCIVYVCSFEEAKLRGNEFLTFIFSFPFFSFLFITR